MSLITQIFKSCSNVKKPRTIKDVLMTVVEEVGELATEIAIQTKFKNRKPSSDGVLGEALDTIIAAADIIYLVQQEYNLTDEEVEVLLMERAVVKLKKWEDGVQLQMEEVS